MIDTHAHIDTAAFDEDREEVVQRAFAAGVEKIIVPSIEPKDFGRLQQFVESHENIFRGIGIHPHNVANATDEDLARVEEESEKKKVVAIGEIGLDYFYDFAPKDVQQNIFRKQLRIAKRKNLPVIIHNRDSDEDVVRIVREEQDGSLRGVFHCFGGDENFLSQVLGLGFHVSFTGNITHKKFSFENTVKNAPLDRTMIETDAPYLTPVPFRGKRNEPAYVRYIAEKIAEIKSISVDEVILMTTATAEKLFNLALVLLCFTALSMPLIAQDDEEYDETDVEVVNPYKKFIGFGPVLGTFTIVESRVWLDSNDVPIDNKARPFTWEGIFTYGAAVNAYILDWLSVEAAYVYAKNTKVVYSETNTKGYQENPNIHQVVELSSHFIANPRSRVSFYATVGATFFFNSINAVPNTRTGFNGGAGFYANINTPVGLIVPTAEWRVNQAFGEDKRLVEILRDENGNPTRTTYGNVSSFYSIPRLTVFWYPSF